MKKTFKILTVITIMLISFASMLLFVACDSAESISVGRNDMPRLTFVEGQDLDFSEGKLTVQYSGGKTESIALDSSDVTVTGYDQNTAGRQTVTISYKGLTTTLDVMVIARVAAENVQTVYYVGEQSLDTSKGKIRVANDDGSTFLVSLFDESISFSGFDSSKAVESQTITIRYQKDDADYTGSFNVRIYSSENAKFTAPVKTSYRTHEEFQVNGAYITYSNGASEKAIPVTVDMVSGYNFSTVTEANSPMEQTCIVNYGGKDYSFKITVTYSDVTRLQALLKQNTVVWNGTEIPAINSTEGERSIECANLYFGLSAADQGYIEKDAMDAAIRTAAAYSYGIWSEELEARKNSFIIDEDVLKYTLLSYEEVNADYAVIRNEESSFNTSVELFNKILGLYSDLTIGDQTMKEYLANATIYYDRKDNVSDVLSLTVSLYDALKTVPEEWDDLSAYGTQIDAARDIIANGKFNSSGYRDVYALVSTWRKNDDMFDIIYSYYLKGEDTDSIDKLKNIILPSELNNLYNVIMNAIQEYSAIVNGTGTGYATDSTSLVYYYRRANERVEQIITGENEMYKTLYETLEFDNILYSNNQSVPSSFSDLLYFLAATKFSYYELMSTVLDDSELVALWNDYLTLLIDTDDEELPDAMHNLMAQLAHLSPAKLKSFLLSVNVYYESYDKLSLDTELNYTFLIRILKTYYTDALSEEEFAMMRNLLLAVESYTCMNDKENAITDFLNYINDVKTAYDALANKKKFQSDFDELYQKYLGYAAFYEADGSLKETFPVEEEWQKVFDKLVVEIVGVVSAYNVITSEKEEIQESVYARLFASYEAARRYADDILANAPDSVKAAYYHNRIEIFEGHSWTLDYAMSVQTMGLGVYNYARLSYSGKPLYVVLEDYDALRSFYADAVAVLWTEETTETTMDAADAARLMKDFLSLSYRERLIFIQIQNTKSFNGNTDDEETEDTEEETFKQFYYDGLSVIFERAFEKNEKLVAATKALFDVETALMDYMSYSELEIEDYDEEDYAESLAEVRSNIETLETTIEALNGDELTQFNEYFSEIVSHYQELYADIPVTE